MMRSEPWHLDKRVPIALIATIAAQTIGMVWWVASQTSTWSAAQRDHERRILLLEQANAATLAEARRLAEALARLDERVIAQTAILRRIEDKLQQQQPRPQSPY
jgi:hypothetical protein